LFASATVGPQLREVGLICDDNQNPQVHIDCSEKVAQGLGFRAGQVAVEGDEPQPGQQGRGDQGGSQPRGVDPEVGGRKPADAAVFPGADPSPGVPSLSYDVAPGATESFCNTPPWVSCSLSLLF
jgi:hypothetical protein